MDMMEAMKNMPKAKAIIEGDPDKLKQIAEDIKQVADEMGMGMGECMDKIQSMVGEYSMDDNADVSDDGQEEKPDGKKALIVAMLKKKAMKS
jgi:hypothetical protein